jgi:hypothetical protein
LPKDRGCANLSLLRPAHRGAAHAQQESDPGKSLAHSHFFDLLCFRETVTPMVRVMHDAPPMVRDLLNFAFEISD